MLYVPIINEYDLYREFERYGREDYYSFEAYKAIIDYYASFDDTSEFMEELDVIAICGAFSEYTQEEIIENYAPCTFEEWLLENGHIENASDEVAPEMEDEFISETLEAINEFGCVISLENGNFLKVE